MMQAEQPQDGQFVRNLGKHTNLVLTLMFAVSTPLQLWSRIPGTTGVWFYGFFLGGGIVIQCIYSVIKTQALMRYDAIPLGSVVALHLVAFGVHGVGRATAHWRGNYCHSYDPGLGIFQPLYPSLPAGAVRLMSDLSVLMAMVLIFDLADSPIQRDWHLWVVLPAIVLSPLWIKAREAHLHQKHIDAVQAANYYTDTIKRR